jgi:hypothetical protein
MNIFMRQGWILPNKLIFLYPCRQVVENNGKEDSRTANTGSAVQAR